jgi:hypothetical protein
MFILRLSTAQPDSTPEETLQIPGNRIAWLKGINAAGNFVGSSSFDDGGNVL